MMPPSGDGDGIHCIILCFQCMIDANSLLPSIQNVSEDTMKLFTVFEPFFYACLPHRTS